MSCLSLAFVEQLVIWLIVIGAIYAIIQLLIPRLNFAPFGIPLAQIINIILGAIIAIVIVYIIFAFLYCLLGSGPPFHMFR